MAYSSEHHEALASLLKQLSFHIDDSVAVNAAFVKWRESPTAQTARPIDIWAYTYTYRYFISKSIQYSKINTTETDQLIELTVAKIFEKKNTVSAENKFAEWVSVVCLNTFRSFQRSRTNEAFIYDERLIKEKDLGEETEPCSGYDYSTTYQIIHRAINTLPESLKAIAFMKLLDGLSYSEIEEKVQKPLPIIRSYINKAKRLLQSDAEIRALIE